MLKLPPYTIAGIDYGSKLAGTTVLAVQEPGSGVQLFCSQKGKDADIFLQDLIRQFQPRRVFIDAPLSLPGVYRQLPDYDDYFFRKADRALHAMSPMFLGGLTARAIQLKNKLLPDKVQFIEAYPAGWVGLCAPAVSGYKDKSTSPDDFFLKILGNYPLIILPGSIATWHHADALIALMSGLRYENQQHKIFGDPEEGEIVI